MALWSGLGQAATVAQLVGVDAAGLVSSILQAVRTARRNRKECRQLARRVVMVGDLLQLLQDPETTRRPEVRAALDGLGGALRQAHGLVESCQEGGVVRGLVMGGRQAEQFRDVQSEIDSYLLVFPVVSHIDITRRLDRIYNMLLPPAASHQISEEVPDLPTSHFGPDARSVENTLEVIQLQTFQTITELSEVAQHEGAGHQDNIELFTTVRMSNWLCWWPREDVPEDAPTQQDSTFFKLLKKATSNFTSESEIGSGGRATIYKGQINNGPEVVIKRYRKDSCVQDEYLGYEFESECHAGTKLQHPNIIKLLGHYTGQGEMILVFEYMRNMSLDKFIFDVRREPSLNWSSRYLIIEGIVQGLLFLHTHTDGHIVHRDLKPSNILLDSDMKTKISDFGLAIKLKPEYHEENIDRVTGTFGYMSPEYSLRGIISTKNDVYAFGIVLLEIISAKRCHLSFVLNKGDTFLHEYAWNLWNAGRSVELISWSLHNEARITEITRCIHIALLCIQIDPADRPTMSDVLVMLSCESTCLPAPEEPVSAHTTQDHMMPSEDEATWSSSEFTWPR